MSRLAAAIAFAACALSSLPAAAQLVFAVTEGVTYQATPKEIREKFEPLADAIGKALRREVRIVLVPAYDDARAGLARQEFDIAFVHPAHVSLAEVKTGRYRTLAWTAGFTDYTVSLLTRPDAPLKSLEDIRGRMLVTPDPDSITAVMVRAMLREQKLGANDLKVRTTRYQDAVPFYLDNHFAQVGATASRGVVKSWTDKGGKVGVQSRPVPIKQFIASTRLSGDDADRVRDVLLNLAHNDLGKKALAASGYRAFVAPNAEVEATTIVWLGL